MTEVQDKEEKGQSRKLQPLWVNVADTLRRRIEHGYDSKGLSDIALSNEFNVSTAVVRQAVGQLVEEGLLVRQRGKGTFVTKEPLQGGLNAVESFFDEWQLQGRTVRVELLDDRMVAASMTVAAGLGVRPGEMVVYLRRLRFADELPVAVDYRYIPTDLVEGIREEEFLQEAIWRVLRHHKNVEVAESRITIKAAAANAEVAGHLSIEVGEPVLVHEVQVCDARGRVIILGRSMYHSERFVYTTVAKARRS
jgi:GntR family transcriptional regulator